MYKYALKVLLHSFCRIYTFITLVQLYNKLFFICLFIKYKLINKLIN